MRKRIEVAAAIICKDGKIFATQRGGSSDAKGSGGSGQAGGPCEESSRCAAEKKDPFAGKWEFPGGKLEEGESPEQAAVREIREELDADIIVKKFFETVEYDYPQFHLTMHCFLCELASEHMILKEHKAGRWLSPEEVMSIDWLPADIDVAEKLASGKY